MRFSVGFPDSLRSHRRLRGKLPLFGILTCLVLSCALAWAAPAGSAVIHQAADYVEWGRLKEARSLLASAIADPANQNNARLIAYYGHILMQFGDNHAGMNLTKRAVSLDGNCATCHLYLFEAMAEKAKNASHVRALLLLPKLKKQLEQAASINPTLGDVQWGWIKLDLELPKTLGGGEDNALQHADALIRLDPVDGHLARATIFEANHQPDAALAEYRAAAKDHPADPRGVFALGKALYDRGDYAAAETYLASALKLNPRSALYSAYDAANLVHLKRLEDARSVLDQGRELHPDSRLGDYLTAQALRDVGQDFVWARQLVQSYLEVPPEPDQPTEADAKALLSKLS